MTPEFDMVALLESSKPYDYARKVELLLGPPLDLHRVEAFFNKELKCQELVVLAQDALEAGQLIKLGPDLFRLILHCIDRELVTTSGRYLH